MFTGIIEEQGVIAKAQPAGGGIRFTVDAERSSADLSVNDSVSINGACLTVIRKLQKSFEVEAVEETLTKTTLGSLKRGDQVNLELPMRLNERMGGHMVLGHVDCVAEILRIEKRELSWMMAISIPPEFTPYIVHAGSIAVDGVSLTVAQLKDAEVRISIIPHTMENTIFKHSKVGDRVNVEFDIIGKYIERLLHPGKEPRSGPLPYDEQRLREMGY